MAEMIRFLLQNFTLTMLGLWLVASTIAILRVPRPRMAADMVRAILSYFILFTVSISYLHNFIVHVFFHEWTARFIGWPDSPFQAEVGFASLGFALVGLLAFRGSFDMRVAAILAPSCLLLGAAATHALDMARTQNFAPVNAGVIFYTDILLPMIGGVLVGLEYRFTPMASTVKSASNDERSENTFAPMTIRGVGEPS
jgi:hypothetical protein